MPHVMPNISKSNSHVHFISPDYPNILGQPRLAFQPMRIQGLIKVYVSQQNIKSKLADAERAVGMMESFVICFSEGILHYERARIGLK